jgi:hypothetical protein
MSAGKRGRKIKKEKDTEAASTPSAEQGVGLMEVYDEIAHNM